ncbi:hypothetical protein JXA56_04780 [Candidatus Micrarchaeota archaeon]|nr:hypothetical protein [Candidatus Micrarchaeota archaeon]
MMASLEGIQCILEEISNQIYHRTTELLMAPLNQQQMLWTSIPLLVATLFMILYFARYRREELGWNTAFGNTMVFMFAGISIVREMYEQGGSLETLFSNELYMLLCIGLIAWGAFLMFFTYFHLIPKKFAFFILSAPPINVTVYVIMTIVYADVVPDYITALAAIVLLVLILILAKILQALLKLLGLEYIEDIAIISGIAEKKPKGKH